MLVIISTAQVSLAMTVRQPAIPQVPQQPNLMIASTKDRLYHGSLTQFPAILSPAK